MKEQLMAQIRNLDLYEEDIDGSGDAPTWVLKMAIDTAAHF
ncbi:hypothetical protein [Streptomyces sp. NPDC054865]